MKSVFNFIIKPLNERYNNTIDIDGKSLILNTDNFQHKYVSREALVIKTPAAIEINRCLPMA